MKAINYILLSCISCCMFVQAFAISQNTGFENGSTDWQFTGSGTFSVNTASLYYRTGVQSLKLSTSSTTDSKAYDASYTCTAAANGTNYITVIGWIRTDVAIGECAVGIYDVTTSTLTKAAATFSPITSGFSSMYATFAATNGHTYYPYLYGRSTTGAAVNLYYDDVIIYTSTNSSTDLTEPAGAANGVSVSVSGTSVTLSWTNGTDGESGVDGIMILRTNSGQTANLTVRDQCNYNTSSTYGPTTIGVYTVLYNGSSISTYTDATGANGTYTYLLLMRDMAYNYTPLASETRAIAIFGTNQSTTLSSNTSHDGMYIAATCTLNVSSSCVDTVRNHASADVYGVINMQGNFLNSAGGTVNFRSGGLYRFNRNGNASIPVVTANWLTGSTCKIEGMTNTAPQGMNQTFANFTWTCASQTGAASFPSGTFNVNGDLTITSTNTGNLTLNNHTLKGNFTHSGGTVYYTTNDTITFSGTSTQTIDITGPVESFYIDNNVTLNHNLTLNKIITLHTGSFNNSSKTLTLASGSSIVRYTGTFSATPTFGGNHAVTYMSPVTTDVELPTTGSALSDLTVNTNGDVTLNSTCYVNNTIYFTNGYFVTSTSNLIIINNDAIAIGGSTTSFVKGPMQKVGNDAFTFDVGKTGYYKPIAISAPNNNNGSFQTEYMRADPNGSYDVTKKDASINHISRCEYWTMIKVQGPTQIYITLPWDATSCGISDLSSLIVAHWDGGMWKDEGQGTITGNTSSGTVQSGNAISNFTPPFTLASRTGANALPITLTSFEVQCVPTIEGSGINPKGEKAKLTWSTASETNSDYFAVQRSDDGIHFSDIAKMNAAGNSTTNTYYEYLDPMAGVASNSPVYYRLKETDADGTFMFSKIHSLRCDQETVKDFSITSNYNRDGKLIIKYTTDFSSDCLLTIYSNSGGILSRNKLTAQKGTNEFILHDFHPSAGVYLINVLQDGRYTSAKILSY